MNFNILRSSRRTLCLEVRADLNVFVRAPHKLSEKHIRHFVESRSAWIEKTRSRLRRRQARQTPLDGPSRIGLFFQGRRYSFQVDPAAEERFFFKEGFFIHPLWASEAERAAEAWYRRMALPLFTERVRYFAEQAKVNWDRIRISGARTRWGSCSARGVISLNWRLLMCPPTILDYVVIHELCHLQELNHSRRFWKKVEDLCPGYRETRMWLRDHGNFLTRAIPKPADENFSGEAVHHAGT